MDALKAAIWVSKTEDKQDALRLRFHRSRLNTNEQESVKLQRLTLATLPDYLKEKGLSGVLHMVSIPAMISSLFKPKSLLGGFFLILFVLMSLGLSVMAVISGGMYYYLSKPVDQQILQGFIAQHQQSIAVSVYDKNDQLVGALPPLMSQYGNEVGALYVKKVPPLYWELIKAPSGTLRFDQQQPSFWSLYKKIIQFKDAFYKGINLSSPYQTGNQPDALIMRIAEGLQGGVGNKNKQNLSFIDSFSNRQEALQIARHLYPYLAQNKGEEFKRWSAMHAPLLSAKDDVYGLAAIAATLFGKTSDQLNAGQQALLATAYQQKIKLSLLFSDKPSVQQTTWKHLLKKTKIRATRYLQKTQPQTLRRVLVDLDNMNAAPVMIISAQWLKFIEKKQSQGLSLYQHLLQRSELTLGKVKTNLYQHLQKMNTDLGKGTFLTDVKISLPVLKNQQLDQTLATTFRTVHRFYPKLFNKKLGETIENKGAVISIQIANEEGNVIRSYQRGVSRKRPIAGLGTLAIGSLLLAQNDNPKTRYCNKSYAGIRNTSDPLREGITNCKSLTRKGYSFSLQQSIAKEKALPLLYALTETHKLSSTQLTTLYKNFSLSSNASMNDASNAGKLAYELSIGRVDSTPRELHATIHAITRNLYGIPYDNNPTLIESVEIHKLVSKGDQYTMEHTSHRGSQSKNNVEQYFNDSTTRGYMKSLFSIPSTKKNNPLKFLRSVEKKYGVDFLLVKSATAKTVSGNTKDKWLVGSVRLKQHIYSFTMMIGSDDRSAGLGKNISHQQLMLPVINTMMESLH